MNKIEKNFEAKRRREKLKVSYKSMHELNMEALKEYKEH